MTTIQQVCTFSLAKDRSFSVTVKTKQLITALTQVKKTVDIAPKYVTSNNIRCLMYQVGDKLNVVSYKFLLYGELN